MQHYRRSKSSWLISQALCFCLLLQGTGIAHALPLPPKQTFVSQSELGAARLGPPADSEPAAASSLARYGDEVRASAKAAGSAVRRWLEDLRAEAAAEDETPVRVVQASGTLPLPSRLMSAFLASSSRGQAAPPSPPGLGSDPVEATPPAELANLLEKAGTGELPLLAGFNLISLPEEPADSDPEAVFAAIAGQLDHASAYNACDLADPWKVYDPADSAASDLTVVDPKIGMWVEATAAAVLPSAGTLPPTTTIELCEGWNLIGFPAAQPRHPHVALSSIAGKWQRIFGYDAFDPEDPWEYFDPAVPDWANDLRLMHPSRGYWVLASEAATLEIRNQGPPPTVAIASPADLAVVTQPTEILGTVDSDRLDSWTLTSRPIGAGDAVTLATGNAPVAGGTLATFDPTLLLNGLYELELTATDVQGQQVAEQIAVVVDGQMKIGHFTLSFIDLAVPLSGLSIEVVRTYDSRRRQQLGDFGFGWNLDIRQGSYRNNRLPGDGWSIPATTGPWGLPCSVVQEGKSHLTTVRLSDQEVYRFRLVLESPSVVFGGCFAEAAFEWVDGPLPGTTLDILGNTQVFVANGSNQAVVPDTQEPFVPENVELTTRDGRIFHIGLEAGVTHLEDLSGNTLEITPAGITHSSGRGVEFVRDGHGRISEIIGPRGTTNTFTYDETTDDLSAHTDRSGAQTTFAYTDHFLEEVNNALGIRAVRTEYDSEGRMVRLIDASGKKIDFNHNLENRREVISNRLGFTRVLEYDERGNVFKTIDELGEVTLRTYDGNDNLLTDQDPLGRITTFAYTAANGLESVNDPLGHATTFTYFGRGLPKTITDPLGHVTTNVETPSGLLASTKDAEGHQTEFGYNSRGDLVTITDALSHTTSLVYDDFGNLEQQTDGAGNETSYTYDESGNRLTEVKTRTLPDGQIETLTTSYEYNELDRLIAVAAPDGSVTRASYDALGRLNGQVDALGRTTTYQYNPQGQIEVVTHADGTTTQNVFDDEGRRIARIDALGRVTDYVYDPVGRLLSTIYPGAGNPTVTHAYDAAGRMVATTDERGFTTSYVYDAAGRRTKVIDALGNELVTTYDDSGRLETMTNAEGHETSYIYDKVGRLRFVVWPDGSRMETTYDAIGLRTARIDQEGRKTQYGHDVLGRLTSVKDALQQQTSYAYDEMGNLRSQTDANGHTAYFEYDALGRQTARQLPDGVRETFAYYANGNLRQHVDFNGATKNYIYDAMDRLLERQYPDGTHHAFTYSSTGKRLSARDHRGGVTLYEYDARDRVIRKTDPTGHRLEYAYDPSGNRTMLTAVLGSEIFTTTTTHDASGRIETVTDPSGGVYAYTYHPTGLPETLTYPNGVETAWTFDSQSRLETLTTQNSGGELLQSYHYTMALTGHRTRVEEADGTVRAYRYDDLWRLIEDRVTNGAGDLVYQEDLAYDPVGNRLQSTWITTENLPVVKTFTYDSRDRVSTNNGQTWTWDPGGRLLARPDLGGDSDATYQWWTDDQLLRIDRSDGSAVETVYDVEGNRIETKETADGMTDSVGYLVDDSDWLSHVIADFKSESAETVYVRGGDQLLGLQTEAENRYYHVDGLGSVRGLSDATGAQTDTMTYSAFGERMNQATDVSGHGFVAEPWSSRVQLVYLRARWLDPSSGRFLSLDPAFGSPESPVSHHRYLYATADPVNNLDPTGKVNFASLNIGMAIQGFMVTLNAYSFVKNTVSAIKYSISAINNFQSDNFWFGVGDLLLALAHGVFAVLSAYGLRAGFFNAPPKVLLQLQSLKALGPSGGRQMLVLVASQAELWRFVTSQVVPALLGTSFVLMSSTLGASGSSGSSGGSSGGDSGSASSEPDRQLKATDKQIQKKFKHAKDFGVDGNYNRANADRFKKALESHVKRPDVQPVAGKYRGTPAFHYVDAASRVNVVTDTSGNFVSGWKLSVKQLEYVLTTGNLGGG